MNKISVGLLIAVGVVGLGLFFPIKAKSLTFQPLPVDDYTIKEVCMETTLFFRLINLTIPSGYSSKVVGDEQCQKKPFHIMKESMLTRWGCQRDALVLRCQQPLGKFFRDANKAAEQRMKGNS